MGNRKANGSRYNLKSRGLSMGSQYKGCYLINWTVARTFMVLNVMLIYLLAHAIPMFVIHESGEIKSRHAEPFKEFLFVICYSLLLSFGSVCVVMFLGVPCLILIVLSH